MNNNYYPYQPYQPTVNQPSTNSGIVWVQGLEGAKAYPVGAGNNVLLMDSESSVFYIKSTDQSGMPMPLRVFDYTERNTHTTQIPDNDYVTREEFEKKLSEITKKRGKKDE